MGIVCYIAIALFRAEFLLELTRHSYVSSVV
jgi:hypothetical protein